MKRPETYQLRAQRHRHERERHEDPGTRSPRTAIGSETGTLRAEQSFDDELVQTLVAVPPLG
ncbi:MAG: hypothetical protein ACR2ND_11060 [Solirubrobacteraceae bacterium]